LAARSGADALGEADETLAQQAVRHFGMSNDELSRLHDRCKKLVEQLS
jgi:hypothetical protein